jgi:hypothetical protein
VQIRWWLHASVLGVLVGSATTDPGTIDSTTPTSPSMPAANERLLALDPFVGRWVAEGELSGGRSYTAERRYEWTLDRRFLRIHQSMTIDSVIVEEDMVIGWDPAAEALRIWSFASDGSFADGTERPAPGDNRWIFEGTTVGINGEWRTTIFLIDPATFSLLLEIRTDGEFVPAMTIAFRKEE